MRSAVHLLSYAIGTFALLAAVSPTATAQPVASSTYLIGGSVTAENEGVHIRPLMALFGWQVEHPFPTGIAGAPLPVVETIVMAGGLEQSRPLALERHRGVSR